LAIQHTTEFAATSGDVIWAIVNELRSSPRKYLVFEAVYGGGNKPKDAKLLARKTGLSEVTVLQLATPMAHKQYLEQIRDGGRVAFKKYSHINAVKDKILRSAKSSRAATTANTSEDQPHKRIRTRPTTTRWKSVRPGTHRKSDVFVSHATEDKDFVAPLVRALERAGIRVWYDNSMVGWGDDLRRSIDRGLANCRYGIVVFSKAFLRGKRWTEHELTGLLAKERLGRKVLLPIWHRITRADLLRYSPSLADRLAKRSDSDSIEEIVRSLKAILGKK
jgi:TIR domain